MKFRTVLAALAAVTLAAVLVPATASAQDTTDVYVVHGLNLDGQTAQGDGGTNVTVCAGDTALIADFEFGQIVGPVALTSGDAVSLVVYGGGGVDCAAPGGATALITQDVTPSGAAVAVVATSSGGTAALTPFALNVDCSDAGNGRLTAAHASGDTGEVDVLVDGNSAGTLTFGNSLDADVPAGTYPVEVQLGGAPVVGPADIDVTAQNNTLVFVVGNIGDPATPVVPLIGGVALAECEAPVDPTTTTTTPAAPVAPATPATPVSPSSAAAPISFTG